jgi:hypothetical protein
MRQQLNEVILLLIVVWKIDKDHRRAFDLPQFQGEKGCTSYNIRFRGCSGVQLLNFTLSIYYNKMKLRFGLDRQSENRYLICEPVV